MKSIVSLLSIIALGFGLLSCTGGGGGGGGSTPAAFAVSTTAADFGVVGNAYTSTLAVTGGTAPFTWTQSGGVPTGLSLAAGTGVVSGTPTAAGNFNATFTVLDSTGMTAIGFVLFTIHPRTDRVSVDSNGTAGNGASTEPVINNTDGRFIAFTSLAALTALPGGSGSQIFVHDRQTSLPSLVSRDNLGSAGNGASSQPAISADGRFVAFTSAATNLAPTPGGSGTQIFLRDTQTNQTILISRDTLGNAGNGASSQPAISADGRFVAFTAAATNLAPTPGGSGTQIFLRDTQTNQTILISRDTLGNAGNGASNDATISANGQLVAFMSVATNLAPLIGGSGSQIFLRDTVGNVTSLVSQEIGGNAGNGASSQPTISATNGQFIAFVSLATNLAAIPGGSGSQIYLRDTQGNQTSLVSKDNNLPPNAGNGASGAPAVVGDGGFVTFSSLASTLASGANAGSQVYVRALP